MVVVVVGELVEAGPLEVEAGEEGEKESAYTGPECPMSIREEDGPGSEGAEGRIDVRGCPVSDHTLMYESDVPAATSRLSEENSMQLILVGCDDVSH